jgi:hypothetical protein
VEDRTQQTTSTVVVVVVRVLPEAPALATLTAVTVLQALLAAQALFMRVVVVGRVKQTSLVRPVQVVLVAAVVVRLALRALTGLVAVALEELAQTLAILLRGLVVQVSSLSATNGEAVDDLRGECRHGWHGRSGDRG